MSLGRWADRLPYIFASFAFIAALAPLANAQGLDAMYFVCGFGALFVIVLVIIVYLMVRALVRKVSNTVSSASYMLSKGVVDGILDTPPSRRSEPAVSRPYPEEHVHYEPHEHEVKEAAREVVKVPCEYCGTAVDSTASECPSCGAPVAYRR